MLRRSQLCIHIHASKTLKHLLRNPSFGICSANGSSRNDGRENNTRESDSENEWERLIKPFDLKELRRSGVQMSPIQLCEVLRLPLDIPTSIDIFEWAGSQRSYSHTYAVYHILVDKLGKASEFKAVEAMLARMKEEGVIFREGTFISIIKSYGRAGFPGKATRILSDMKTLYSCNPTFRSYNAALFVLLTGDCPAVARRVFDEMLSEDLSPSAYTFFVVMKCLCLVNEVGSACSLLREMTKHGCVPTSEIYHTLIHAQSKSDASEAVRLFEEMLLMGCSPQVWTLRDVVGGLCRAGRVDEAAKLLDRMSLRDIVPDNQTYGVLIRRLCRSGEVDRARSVLGKLAAPNEILFNTVIHGYVTEGRLEEAEEILRGEMARAGLRPDIFTYNTLIHGLCEKGLIHSARSLALDMGGTKPNVVTYTTLIDALCKENRAEEAGSLLKQMESDGHRLNTVGYNCLISAMCRGGNVNRAFEMLAEMRSKGCKPDVYTFTTLIFGLCEADRIEEALVLSRDMVSEGVIANTVTYNTIITALLKRGELKEAVRLVNDMVFRNCPLDGITYNALIKALCEAGAIERAMGLLDDMAERGVRGEMKVAVNLVVNGLCRAGRVEEAMAFLGDGADIVTYNSLINGLCKSGRIAEAFDLFERLQDRGTEPDAITYNTLIASLCREGMGSNAFSLLSTAVDKGFVPDHVTWIILVRNLSKGRGWFNPI